jgi:hypothetical protein
VGVRDGRSKGGDKCGEKERGGRERRSGNRRKLREEEGQRVERSIIYTRQNVIHKVNIIYLTFLHTAAKVDRMSSSVTCHLRERGGGRGTREGFGGRRERERG